MEKQYLAIMKQSLEKKTEILDRIIEKNKEQNEILSNPDMQWDDFDKNANRKMELIEEMQKLDDGFEELFERVRGELEAEGGKQKHADDIRCMKELISQITEKSVAICRKILSNTVSPLI